MKTLLLTLCLVLSTHLTAATGEGPGNYRPLPVSINAVLVPSDLACNACATGQPLHQGVGASASIYPSDETCRKCGYPDQGERVDTKTQNEAYYKCSVKYGEVKKLQQNWVRAVEVCQASPSDSNKAKVWSLLLEHRDVSLWAIRDCSRAYSLQEDRAEVKENIELFIKLLRGVNVNAQKEINEKINSAESYICKSI